MRKLLFAVLLVAPFAAEPCLAQVNALDIYCEACRDANEHPEDFANFALNQIYGPDAWMDFDRADDFFIINSMGQTVYVDADFVMLGIGIDGLRLPFWPTNTIQFTLALPNGTIHTILRSVFLTSLPVPASVDGQTPDATTGGNTTGDGGDDGEDDPNDEPSEYDWDGMEIDGPEGTTRIEDPDEDGNFDEADWCEEC